MAGSRRVLVVEDDLMVRDLYRSMLVNAHYAVETAENSEELYKKLKFFHPDCILLDVMLPGISGLDILKVLRTNPDYGCQKIKIVLLTNLAQQSITESAIERGADGYIIKADVLPNDLPAIIESLFEKST